MPIGIGKGGALNIGTPVVPTAPASSFSPAYATVATSESTSTTAYGDLATVGPSVTVTVGSSGKLQITFGAFIFSSSNGWSGVMSFALSGANTLAASDANSVLFGSPQNNYFASVSRTIILTGLNPGSTTITAKYKSNQSGFVWNFQYRDLTVTPL